MVAARHCYLESGWTRVALVDICGLGAGCGVEGVAGEAFGVLQVMLYDGFYTKPTLHIKSAQT